MPTVGITEYWFRWLEKVKASGIRPSKEKIVEEALARHRRAIENEIAEFEEFKEKKKNE